MKNGISVIASHPFLSGLPSEQLKVVCECAREIEFPAGEIIFRQGEPASRFYLIREGKVALESHSPGHPDTLIQTLENGEALGWSWLFPPFVWQFQARALEKTTAIVFDGGHLLPACERDHDLGYHLMKLMSKVVIQRLQATRRKLLETQGRAEAAEKELAAERLFDT